MDLGCRQALRKSGPGPPEITGTERSALARGDFMADTWLQRIEWTDPQSLHQLTAVQGARKAIPTDRGFYAFVEGKRQPSPDRTLYLGIAVGKRGLYGRLGSYLRKTVKASKAEKIVHEGKRRLSFARIKGLDGSGGSQINTPANDKFIHLCWAVAPLDFASASAGRNEREWAYMLERALIDYYRPLYNTADWEADLDLELDEIYGEV